MRQTTFRLPFFVFFTALLLLCAVPRGFCAEARLLDITLPITGKGGQAVIQALEQAAQDLELAREQQVANEADPDGFATVPTLILQFKVPPNQEEFGRGSSFGACYEIANLLTGEKFARFRTVAYFPQSIKGHALLVGLACQERAIAENADIGEATVDEEELSDTERSAYLEIARHRGALSLAVVEKMFDSGVELLEVETEAGLRLLKADEVETLRQRETFAEEPKTLLAAGTPGIFSAETARRIGLDRVALSRGLGLRPDEIKPLSIANASGQAIRIDLTGLITPDNTGAAMRSLKAALDLGSPTAQILQSAQSAAATRPIGFLCLYIDSPGGNLEASLNLAAYLLDNVDSNKVRTVAYIPHQARADAALIALACDEIVLGPGAKLGGDGAVEFSAQQIADSRKTIQDFFSKAALRSWSLPVAFIDRDIEVFQATRPGKPPLVEYFSAEELAEQPDAELWQKGEIVKARSKHFEIIGGQGESFFVDRIAQGFAEFKFLYGLENEPLMVEPSWADRLVQWLTSPGMSTTVLLIVFFAILLESNAPGLGIGAFVAVLGLAFFFWISFLGGTSGWLEILLFLIGMLCVALEIFVLPGFGVFGLGGAATIIIALVLASQTFIIPQNSYQLGQFRNSILILVISGIGVFVLGGAISKAIHRASRPKNQDAIEEQERLAKYDHLLGALGTAFTPLVPAGKAFFNGEPVDVVSEGELIEKDTKIEVVQVIGYRVVVRAQM